MVISAETIDTETLLGGGDYNTEQAVELLLEEIKKANRRMNEDGVVDRLKIQAAVRQAAERGDSDPVRARHSEQHPTTRNPRMCLNGDW